MKHLIPMSLALLVSGPTLRTAWQDQEIQEATTKKSPAELVAELKKEFGEARAAFNTLYAKAKSDEEKQKLLREKYPRPQTYLPRFWRLAEKYPEDPAVAECLVWIVSYDRKEKNKALRLLLENHIENEALAGACSALTYEVTPDAENFLRTLIEKSPHRAAQGKACYTLAQVLKRQASTATVLKKPDNEDTIARYVQYYGQETVDRLRKSNPDELRKQSEGLLEKVVKEYGDLDHRRGSLEKAAKGDLFEIRNLAIGRTAPEIEGEDIDGVRFRLGEYRGKVVVLDFWGHW